MSRLFETTEIKGMQLANRFVRSATWEGMATEDGTCTPRLIDLMARLAQGGVGLIITGHAYVRTDGQAVRWQLGVYKDELIKGLREMTRSVHKHGSRIALQIAHAGLFANPELTGQPGPERGSTVWWRKKGKLTVSLWPEQYELLNNRFDNDITRGYR